MAKLKEMTGMVIGRFTVIKRCGNSGEGVALWLCRCECGNERIYKGVRLRHKPPLSCGCDLRKIGWSVGGVREGSGRKPLPLKEKIRYTIDSSGCWIWAGSKKGGSGYGRVSHEGRYIGAHRGSYMAYVGEIPEGLLVLHKCDVKLCVNPSHLFVGTHSDNMQDMLRKGRGRYQ